MPNRDVIVWSTTAASNSTADANIGWAEGQAPSSVNDSARAMMAAVAKYRDDISGAKITLAGAANTYTATTNQTVDTLVDGLQIGFICNATNTGASTLNVNSIGAKDLQVVDGADLPAGALVANALYLATYDSGKDAFLLVGYYGHQTHPPGAIIAYGGSSAPTGWLLCDGTAVSRTGVNAALFAIVGTAYGTGDGATTFNLPNLVGRVPAGVDAASARLDSFTTLGSTIGLKTTSIGQTHLPSGVTLTGGTISGSATGTFSGTISGTATGPLPDHTHPFTADVGAGGSVATAGAGVSVTSPSVSATGTQSAATVTINTWGSASVSGTPTINSWGSASVSISLGGSATGLPIVQPTLAVNYIIKL